MTDTSYGGEMIEDRDAPETRASVSPLAQMAKELESLSAEIHTWDIPKRPKWRVQFNTYIPSEDMKRLRDGAREKSNRPQRRSGSVAPVDFSRLYMSILLEYNEGIQMRTGEGEGDDAFTTLAKENGEPITFRDPEFLAFVQSSPAGSEVASTEEAVEAFLSPGYVAPLGDAILMKSGYGAEAEPLDP